jgi:hypothetical protein
MSFHQDLDNLTRDLHDATWEVEYMKKNPVVALMLQRKDLKFRGGKRYYKEVDTGTHEDNVQDYSVNETLTHGVVDSTEQVFFRKKKFQCPVQIDVDEEIENANQTSDKTRLHSLAEFRVRKANEACRVHLRKLMYRRTTHSLAASDTNKYMQGLDNALTVDHTYGTITRTYSAGTSADTGFWWQPMGGTVSANTGANTISISWLRTQLEPLEDLETDNTDLITICGGTLWLSLQAEAEARSMPYTIEKNRVAKQGFKEMILDERRVIKDPFLKVGYNSTMGETTASAGDLARRVYCLNLKDWDFYIHPDRNFRITEFFDQKKIAGGADFKLARVLFAGNLVCWHPNRQLYYNHVAA